MSNLASRVLGLSLRRLPQGMQAAHGYLPEANRHYGHYAARVREALDAIMTAPIA